MSNHIGRVYRNRKTGELGKVEEIRRVFRDGKQTLEYRLRFTVSGSPGIYLATHFYRLYEKVED